jgi:hypothetical protein
MELDTLLELERETILGEWYDLIIRTYPPVTVDFLKKQEDQFRNPLGHAITESIGRIYDEVRSAMDADRLSDALDGIIRIRSVQDFTASEAVSFIFDLKPLIHRAIDSAAGDAEARSEMVALDAKVDRVALLAFEKYMACRDTLHEIRIKEIRNRVARLLQGVDAGADISVEKGSAARDGT